MRGLGDIYLAMLTKVGSLVQCLRLFPCRISLAVYLVSITHVPKRQDRTGWRYEPRCHVSAVLGGFIEHTLTWPSIVLEHAESSGRWYCQNQPSMITHVSLLRRHFVAQF
jgi:hypothetical protein